MEKVQCTSDRTSASVCWRLWPVLLVVTASVDGQEVTHAGPSLLLCAGCASHT
jgi:hypothetical protein